MERGQGEDALRFCSRRTKMHGTIPINSSTAKKVKTGKAGLRPSSTKYRHRSASTHGVELGFNKKFIPRQGPFRQRTRWRQIPHTRNVGAVNHEPVAKGDRPLRAPPSTPAARALM